MNIETFNPPPTFKLEVTAAELEAIKLALIIANRVYMLPIATKPPTVRGMYNMEASKAGTGMVAMIRRATGQE